MTICAFYSFLGNATLLGPSVYITVWAEEFGIDPGTASGLISYSNLAYGFGSLIWVGLSKGYFVNEYQDSDVHKVW